MGAGMLSGSNLSGTTEILSLLENGIYFALIGLISSCAHPEPNSCTRGRWCSDWLELD